MKTISNEKPVIAEAELISVRKVAELLGCSSRHIYRLCDAGKMPRPIKLGTLVKWRRSELVKWLDSNCPAVSADTE